MYITDPGKIVVAQLTRLGRQILADNSANFKITHFRFSDDEIDYSMYDGSSLDNSNIDLSHVPVLEPCTNIFASQRYELFPAPTEVTDTGDGGGGGLTGSKVSLTGSLSGSLTGSLTADEGPIKVRFPIDPPPPFTVAVLDTDATVPFKDGGQGLRDLTTPWFKASQILMLPILEYPVGSEYEVHIRTYHGYDTAYSVQCQTITQSTIHENQNPNLMPPFITVKGEESVAGFASTDPTVVNQHQSQGTAIFRIVGTYQDLAEWGRVIPKSGRIGGTTYIDVLFTITGVDTKVKTRFAVRLYSGDPSFNDSN